MSHPDGPPDPGLAAAGRPPGYPAEFERVVRLHDGRRVQVRPIVPGDAPELAEAIRTADADTLRRRFLGGTPPVTPKLLHHLTVVDYHTRFALVARDAVTGQGVAIARYEGMGEGVAEVAVAVDRAWRHVGLATVLVRMLAEAASTRGIHTFSAYYLADNRAVDELFTEAAAGLVKASAARISEGVAEREVDLDRGQDQRPAGPGATTSTARPRSGTAG